MIMLRGSRGESYGLTLQRSLDDVESGVQRRRSLISRFTANAGLMEVDGDWPETLNFIF